MKKLEKLKKNFVINTTYLPKKSFNEPVYIVDSNKEFVTVYSFDNKKNISLLDIKIDDILNTKTFITIKEFFKKCEQDNTEYKIEKVENGDIYIRVAYFNDLSLFYRFSYKNMKSNFVLTNINKYKFYKTNNNITRALDKTNIGYLEKEKLERYLSNLKNIKRDYLFSLKNNKEILEKQIKKETK